MLELLFVGHILQIKCILRIL